MTNLIESSEQPLFLAFLLLPVLLRNKQRIGTIDSLFFCDG